MDTSALKKFAQEARRSLRDQVTAKLDLALAAGSAARREVPGAVDKLEKAVRAASRDQVVEKVAYTWFNRFSALRFMDANGLTGVGVLSPREGETRPEILSEAMAGVVGSEVPVTTADTVRALLDGRAPSRDPQGEAYRLLVVAACNHWHGLMPFLFEPIADETELLMPDDLLSASSAPAKLRAVMTDEACRDVEVIGWLYQFYISEKKDEVFAALKKNVKITPENIPAATQLFTPHWIVRYLVENSLGRLWLLNRPQSKLAAQMEYYIAPVEPETDFLRIGRPEEIRVCDPACGSGHMLTYAFDLLHAIYEEEGYDAAEIPALILTHNLHGIEIDDRAGALAAFALAMKVAAKLGRRKFLRTTAKPDICVLQNVRFTAVEMQDVAAVVGRDLFSAELRETLRQFEEAKNFGSLIVPKLCDPAEVARVVRLKDFGSDLLLREVHVRVLAVLDMAEALAPKYHVVVANPPYMGGKGMNETLVEFLSGNFPDVKSDLFAAFIFRTFNLVLARAQIGLVTPFTWMFIQTYEPIRREILSLHTLTSLIRPEYHSFFDSAFVPLCAFCISSHQKINATAQFIDLGKFIGADLQPLMAFEAISNPYDREWSFLAKPSSFTQIPGSPIAYWVSDRMRDAFSKRKIRDVTISDGQTKSGDNGRFLRLLWEVSKEKIGRNGIWVKHPKGGGYRKWFGNLDTVLKWDPSSRSHYRMDRVARLLPEYLWWKQGISWTLITSSKQSFRLLSDDEIFNLAAPTLFPRSEPQLHFIMGFLNTPIVQEATKILNPTMNMNVGDVQNMPLISSINEDEISLYARGCVTISKSDWDAYETSWDFTALSLLSTDHRADLLETTYARLRSHWRTMTEEMQRLEQKNNRTFIDAYGLQDELTSDVPLSEITLTCNPAYRYGGGANEEALEARLRADTMAEFLSYAVGCMFGRYSLDAPGLILANQGDTVETYLTKVPSPTFTPTADNVIPVLDGDWFADDVTERFREFLRVTFGDAHFSKNLAFIEDTLGKDVRRYFTRDFFNDHVKRYKKRPIYWLFSSPQGTFSALIYMHRYTPDTVNVLLNEYLRPFRSKLEARRADQQRLAIDPAATPGQRTKADKEILSLEKSIREIDAWERDVIYPLASRRIEIDLDDGVKANYPKFAGALKPIKGLEEAED